MPRSIQIGARNLVSLVFLAAAAPTLGDVIYVDDSAVGANDGSSWCDAFIELQAALAVAHAGDKIRVAAGTYTPDYDPATGRHITDRTATSQLISGITLEDACASLDAPHLGFRDVRLHKTTLTGNLPRDHVQLPCAQGAPDFAVTMWASSC